MKAYKCDRCGSLYCDYLTKSKLKSDDLIISVSGNGFAFCYGNAMLSHMDLCQDCYKKLIDWFSKYWEVLEDEN